MWFRVSWVRVPSPTPEKVGDRGYPGPLFPSTLGRRQVVRQGTLTPSSAGSSPAVPAKVHGAVRGVFIECDPVAQSAEQLPFKQWVRGSNPRRVTSSSQASYRLRRVFYASQQKLIVRSFCCSSLPNRIHFAGLQLGYSIFSIKGGLKRKTAIHCLSYAFARAPSPWNGGILQGQRI